MSKSPCFGCGEREVGCHSLCEKYIDFRFIYDEEQRIIRKNKEKNARQGFVSDKQFANAIKNNKNRVFKQTKK